MPCRTLDSCHAFFVFHLQDFHSLWSSFPANSATLIAVFVQVRNPIAYRYARFRLPSLSLATTQEIRLFSFFSSGYLDVSVPRVPLHMLCIHIWMARVFLAGFPHSDTCGSAGICPSPQLFAACRVFHRLLVPRHPPCALNSLTCCTYGRHSVASHMRAVFPLNNKKQHLKLILSFALVNNFWMSGLYTGI